MNARQTLQAEIAGDEKAIRLLIGEQKALTNKLARERTALELAQAKLHALIGAAAGPGPHGSRFIDISNNQPNVNLAAVRAARSIRATELAFTKLSEGTGFTDGDGPGRLRAMAGHHFPHRGGYHFYHPSESPIVQAEHFLNAAHSHGVVIRETDILACDLEVSDGQPARVVAAGARDFGRFIKQHTPAKLWLYGGGPFLHEFGVQLAPYDAHWLAAYVGDPAPFMVFGRAHTIAWQYTDGVHGPTPRVCPGVGACDLSIVL